MNDVTLMLGDCQERMGEIEDASVDAIICDPPYPEIDRPYGRMTEAEWHAMMRSVVAESRRVLKPSGSAVFILQPNSERVGRMRPWLWEFMAWTTREWNMVQDAWWWAFDALPRTKNDPNTLRSSVKACVWLGLPDCYRDASSVLWEESDRNKTARLAGRFEPVNRNPATRVNVVSSRCRSAAGEKGGVTPFNLLPVAAGSSNTCRSHGAATPDQLCDWWVRYLTPANGVVLDPFMGSGTTGLAALKRGRRFIGIERDEGYFATASSRIAEHVASTPLFAEGVA